MIYGERTERQYLKKKIKWFKYDLLSFVVNKTKKSMNMNKTYKNEETKKDNLVLLESGEEMLLESGKNILLEN